MKVEILEEHHPAGLVMREFLGLAEVSQILVIGHSQSPSAANEWSYVSAPKLQCVYTLSLSHLTSHPPIPVGKGLRESGPSNTTDRPGRLSS